MRLLIVGSDKVYAIENFYTRYLREDGWTVCQFAAQSRFYDYYQQGLLQKLIFKSGLSGILRNINRDFRKLIAEFRPDIIWIFKGMEIYPSSIHWAREKGIKLVNYNPDNPFVFSGKGSGNQYMIDALPLYHLHLTYNNEVKDKLEKVYGLNVEMLPFGFDLNEKVFELCRAQTEIPRLCFLGNPDKQRAAFIEKLAAAGIPVDVYGNYWRRFVNHPDIRIFDPVYNDEFWQVLRRYRVQLNLMRVHNEDSHNMRSFEIPSVGGIMLAPATTEHKKFYVDGKEAFLFNDLQDCIRQAASILALGVDAAFRIREQARKRALSDGYSYRDRSRYISGKLLQLRQGALNTTNSSRGE
jgi:spore maturation protein CgeB